MRANKSTWALNWTEFCWKRLEIIADWRKKGIQDKIKSHFKRSEVEPVSHITHWLNQIKQPTEINGMLTAEQKDRKPQTRCAYTR